MKQLMRQPLRIALLAALACTACDDGAPDGEAEGDIIDAGPDGTITDAGPDAGPGVDLGLGLDGGAPDFGADLGLDAGSVDDMGDAGDAVVIDLDPCPVSPRVDPEAGLAQLPILGALNVGGPAATGAFLVEDLDGARDGAPEYVVARGGRLEAFGARGNALWSTAIQGITTLHVVADVDGDGRREVLATGGAGAWWFDALTGAELWRLPVAAFGAEFAPIVAVLDARIVDLNDDDLPDLYITDSGCTAGGDGLGAAFSFANGFEDVQTLGVVGEPRRGGRCSRWQTLRDANGDGRPDVIRPDAVGIDAMSPRGEGRLLCGPIPGVVGDTNLPHMPLADPDRAAWAVFDHGRVMRLEARVGEGECPDGLGQGTLAVAWTADLGAFVRPQGSFAIDVNGDGVEALVTSVRAADDQWSIVLVDNGVSVPLLANALVEGTVGDDALLVRQQPQAEPARFGALMLMQLRDNALVPLWPAAVTAATPIHMPVRRADRTPEFTPLAQFIGGGRVRVALGIADAQGRVQGVLRAIDQAGVSADRDFGGDPGGFRRVCNAEACATNRIAYTTSGGGIQVVDGALNGDDALVRAPTGLAQLTPVDGLGILALTGDTLGLLNPARPEAPYRWVTFIAAGRRNDPIGIGEDLIVVRDHVDSPTGWRAVDFNGALLWQHQLDQSSYRAQAGGDIAGDLVLRFDRVTDIAGWPPPEACDVTREDPDLRVPLDGCPAAAINARSIIALDARTGVCRWRVALRPARCGSPSNQNITVLGETIYVTSTNEIVELDATTGDQVARADLGYIGASGRGGGVFFEATDGALVRYAGNGPLDVLEADLSLRWRADDEGIRAQSWLLRAAVQMGDQVWVSPAPRAPINRYDLNAAGEGTLPSSRFGVLDGALVDGEGDDIRSIVPTADITPAVDGVLVTADDGWLYAVDQAGQLAWSRRFPASIGPPSLVDFDGDGAREMAIPLSDGRVLLADAVAGAPPEAIWDLPCPAVRSCERDRDIDTTESTTSLCAEWLPREGSTAYEVQVVDANGAVLRDWTDVGEETTALIDGLSLVPGAIYFVRVRSVTADGAGTGGPSDGVRVINDPPPQVELTANPTAIGPGTLSRITVRAMDDDLLAGWALIIVTPDDVLVQRLANGPLAQPDFEESRDWLGDDRNKDPVPPGRYIVRATFEDRAGNVGIAEEIIEVCDGACP
ncbi:MAG: outer membrane protein assembly factor BamB [Bradymonadia bacterium]|jgi:outer membrane protein assembly factor BamB